jgi:hypothetical protein
MEVPIASKISDIYGRKPVIVQRNIAQAYTKISDFKEREQIFV